MRTRLREARRKKGLTQQQLGDLVGVQGATVSRWESGKEEPDPQFIPPVYAELATQDPQLFENFPDTPKTVKQVPQQIHPSAVCRRSDSCATMESEEDMDASKRNTLRKIGSTAGGVFLASSPAFSSLMEIGARLHDEEVLAICKTEIPIWWRLYFDGHHAEIRKVLRGYLLRLSSLAERPSPYQRLAGSLASQAHQLAYLLAIQQQDFCTALMHTQQAFQCGVIAEDFNLQASALIRHGYIYYLVNDPESMLYQYQKALQYHDKVPPLMRGRIYTGLANSHAFLKQEQESLRFLGLTRDTFPEHPEEDPTYAYTRWDGFTPDNYEAVSYLQLNQPQHAWQMCEKIASSGTLRTTFRVELLIRQAETTFALGKMDQSSSYVEQAVIDALRLGSDLRFNQAYSVYQQMLQRWPRERQVKELAELFVG